MLVSIEKISTGTTDISHICLPTKTPENGSIRTSQMKKFIFRAEVGTAKTISEQ